MRHLKKSEYLGYHQIFIVIEDRYKIAFVTNWGVYMESDVVWSFK